MTNQEYVELQDWLSNWKANKRKQNRMFAFSNKESEIVDCVIQSVKSYISNMQKQNK